MNNWKLKISVLRDFLWKYIKIFKDTWPIRKQLDFLYRKSDELEFLPSHLELIETPVSPVPKLSARLIILLAILVLFWSILGKLDIVAVANGKVSLVGRTKIIQPLEAAIVKEIKVKDGDHVKKNQVLVKLIAIGSDSDYQLSFDTLQSARLSKLRYEAILDSVDQKKSPVIDMRLANRWNLARNKIIETEELAKNQYRAWNMQEAQLKAVLKQNKAQLNSIKAQVIKLSKITKIDLKMVNNLKKLVAKDYISKHTFYEEQVKLIQDQNDLFSQRNQLVQTQASIDESWQKLLLNTQILKRDTLDALRQTNEQIDKLSSEIAKAQQRKLFLTLVAPVDGKVQQLITNTIGGVVTPAQQIMVIVPKNNAIEVEAIIENKDIGFIKEGQEAIIKVESFPFTRYGFIQGKVKNVSYDAVQNEKLGLVYYAIISLNKNYLIINDEKIKLSAGMKVSVEIKTGKRRVIDYLLSPIRTKLDESMKER